MKLPEDTSLNIYTHESLDPPGETVIQANLTVPPHPLPYSLINRISASERQLKGREHLLASVVDHFSKGFASNFEKVGEVDHELRGQLRVLLAKGVFRVFMTPHMFGNITTMHQQASEYERAAKELDEFLGMSVDDFLEIYGV